MKPINIILCGALFIFGIIMGYSIYAVTDNYECQLRRTDIQDCIEQANRLLDIVATQEYCAAAYELPYNLNINFTLGGLDGNN